MVFHNFDIPLLDCMRARELFSKNIKCCLSTHCAVNVRERKFIGEVQDASIDQFFSFFLELKISRFFFIFFCKRPSVCFFCNQTKKNVKLKTCFSIKCLEGKKKTKPTSRWALSLIYLIFFLLMTDSVVGNATHLLYVTLGNLNPDSNF